MTALLTIAQAAADGVMLSVESSSADTLKVSGSPTAVQRWLPRLRGQKPVIIKTLLEASALTGDLASIRAWLLFIGEYDPAIIADVLARCCDDTEARSYFAGRAGSAGIGAGRGTTESGS